MNENQMILMKRDDGGWDQGYADDQELYYSKDDKIIGCDFTR